MQCYYRTADNMAWINSIKGYQRKIGLSLFLWMWAFGLVVWFSALGARGSDFDSRNAPNFSDLSVLLLSFCVFCHWLGAKKSTRFSFRLEYLVYFLPPKEQEMWITFLTIWLYWSLPLGTKTGRNEAPSSCFGFCISPTSFQASVPTPRWLFVLCLYIIWTYILQWSNMAKSTFVILNWIRKEVVNCFHGACHPKL